MSVEACVVRTSLLLTLALALGCGEVRAPEADAVGPPNLILLIGDDHGYPDFGFMGSPYVKTPHLDRLAGEGMVFTHGYVTASVCRESLRTLLTGLHPNQWNLRIAQLGREGIELDGFTAIQHFETVPRRLAEHGWASFQAGKYWEPSYDAAGFTHGMQQLGEPWADGGYSRLVSGRVSTADVYRFMDAHREQPFFVWFAPMLPHIPHNPALEYRARYEDAPITKAARAYYGNISRFDDLVGELLAYLDEAQLADHTLVAYLSDNGWHQEPSREKSKSIWDGPRGKGTMYEVGFRTPIVLRWPGRIPAGAVHEELVSTVDLVSTLLDYAGVPPLRDRPGRSLRPFIEGRGEWTRTFVIAGMANPRTPDHLPDTPAEDEARGPAFFLRYRDGRYIWFPESGEEELYEIREDPYESRNRAPERQLLTRLLRNKIERWRVEMARPFRDDS
jgi:uncharacterized sulfatase